MSALPRESYSSPQRKFAALDAAKYNNNPLYSVNRVNLLNLLNILFTFSFQLQRMRPCANLGPNRSFASLVDGNCIRAEPLACRVRVLQKGGKPVSGVYNRS